MRRVLWFSAILLAYIVFYWFVCRQNPQPHRAEWTPQEKTHVIERMKFHGIDSCIKDENGYYFYNKKGQRCKL